MALLLTLALVAFVFAGARLVWNGIQAKAHTPRSGQFITVDGTKLHYQIEGEGPTVILLHGAGGNLREFTFSLTASLTQTYRVVMFDRPGHGYSDRIATRAGIAETPIEQADILSKAATQLGIEKAVIVGHSFGGAVALAWALEHPKQVTGVTTFGGVSNEWEGGLGPFYTYTTTFLGRHVLVPLMSAFASDARIQSSTRGIFAPNPVPDGYLDHVGAALSVQPKTLQATTQQVGTVKPQIIAMEARYGELTMPIELLYGSEDTTVPVTTHGAVFVTQVPSADLTVLDGVGHMPHHADEPAAIQAIKRTVNRAGLR